MPSEEECLKYAKSLERAVRSGDVRSLQNAIDWDAIVTSATTPPQGPPRFTELFRSQTKQGLMSENFVIGKIIKLAHDGGDFRCLRIRTENGTRLAVFRLLIPSRSALDYYDFVLSEKADGKVIASDLEIYRSGQSLSRDVRGEYLPRAAFFSRAKDLRNLSKQDRLFERDMDKRSLMASYAEAGDGPHALAIYSELTVEMQNERPVLLGRVAAANLVGGDEYAKAARAIIAALPNDPCLDIVTRDYYLSCGQHGQYREALDRLEQRTGGDSYLDFLRAEATSWKTSTNVPAIPHARQSIERTHCFHPIISYCRSRYDKKISRKLVDC